MSEENPQMFWDYVRKVHIMCYDAITSTCSRNAHKALQMDYKKTDECMKATFEGGNRMIDDNWAMKAQQTYWKTFGAGFWPSIVINSRVYRGDLDPEEVFSAICSGFADQPSVCSKVRIDLFDEEPKGISGNVLIIVVIGLILLNVVLILLYRRCSNREMKEDMQLQVNSAVSNYFALSTRSSNP